MKDYDGLIECSRCGIVVTIFYGPIPMNRYGWSVFREAARESGWYCGGKNLVSLCPKCYGIVVRSYAKRGGRNA